MSETVLNGDTIALLKECNAGCKSATNSMEQILEHVENPHLKDLIHETNEKHVQIGDECHQLLNEAGEDEKDPQPVAAAFAWMGTEIKMMIKDDTHQAASLLIDGCNMGIKSLCEYMNKYPDADKKSVELCERLKSSEKEFMEKLEAFL